jgi:hypothetical protein
MALIGVAAVVAYIGASVRAQAAPAVDAVRTSEQRYLAALPPIVSEIDQTAEQVGLAVASYETGQLAPAELGSALQHALTTYERADTQLRTLDPPPELGAVQQSYIDAVRLLEQSASDLRAAYADGDEARVPAALALSLEGTARLHAQGAGY